MVDERKTRRNQVIKAKGREFAQVLIAATRSSRVR